MEHRSGTGYHGDTRGAKKIVVASDGTGRTAKRLMDAVLVQYNQANLHYTVPSIYQKVRTRKSVDRILGEIDRNCLVVYSIISRDLSRYFHQRLVQQNIPHLNVLKPMIDTMSKFLGVHPDYRPGLLQIVDDRYYHKIDAIGFTVEHDDGRGASLAEADVVLLGLSRTCKTPISMYLACNHGLKVANIPVVRDHIMTENLLERLKPCDAGKIIGLEMHPDTLAQVRLERSQALAKDFEGRDGLSVYIDPRQVAQEHRFCRELFEAQKWTTIDVTRRAIEEVSLEILRKLGYSEEEQEM